MKRVKSDSRLRAALNKKRQSEQELSALMYQYPGGFKPTELNPHKVQSQNVNPARRSRTTDLRMSAAFDHYSPPLYQLSYHGLIHVDVVI